MKITFLGTGTSHGIPVLGCSCPVCTSSDMHDKRYRSSILVEANGSCIVVDTGYEFRLAGIRAGLKRVDAVLYTHSHSDHLMGLDELRVFTRDRRIPIYANADTIKDIKEKFPYAFRYYDDNYGLPLLDANEVENYRPVEIGGLRVMPIPVMHGCHQILGYRFSNFAYVTDVSKISEKSFSALKGVEVLVLGALRARPHATHFSFDQALEAFLKIGAKKCYFTHINHETSYEDINRLYGSYGIESAYDNLVLEV